MTEVGLRALLEAMTNEAEREPTAMPTEKGQAATEPTFPHEDEEEMGWLFEEDEPSDGDVAPAKEDAVAWRDQWLKDRVRSELGNFPR